MSKERIHKLQTDLSRDFMLAIDVRNNENGKTVLKKMYGGQIKSQYNDLNGLLAKLYHEDQIHSVVLQAYRENGTSWKKHSDPIFVELSDKSTPPVKPQAETVQPNPTPPPIHPQTTPQQHYPLNFGLNGGGYGLSGIEMAKLFAVEEKLKNVNKDFDDLREEYKDLKVANRKLEIENSELKSNLSTAEKEKELAVQSAKMENKSFMDTDTGKEIAKNLPMLAQAFMSRGQAPQGLGQAQAPTEALQGIKGDFIETIRQDEVTDEMVTMLQGILFKYYQNQTFKMELSNLLNAYKQAEYEENNNNQG